MDSENEILDHYESVVSLGCGESWRTSSSLLSYCDTRKVKNVCQSQVSVETQFNVTKAEIKQIINDTINPQLTSCGSILQTRSRLERFCISLPY